MFWIIRRGFLPGVPAISTLNVRSMVLFSNGDPLWSLQDKKRHRKILPLRWKWDSQMLLWFKKWKWVTTNASILDSSLYDFLWLCLFFSVVCCCFLPGIMWKNFSHLLWRLWGQRKWQGGWFGCRTQRSMGNYWSRYHTQTSRREQVHILQHLLSNWLINAIITKRKHPLKSFNGRYSANHICFRLTPF